MIGWALGSWRLFDALFESFDLCSTENGPLGIPRCESPILFLCSDDSFFPRCVSFIFCRGSAEGVVPVLGWPYWVQCVFRFSIPICLFAAFCSGVSDCFDAAGLRRVALKAISFSLIFCFVFLLCLLPKNGFKFPILVLGKCLNP